MEGEFLFRVSATNVKCGDNGKLSALLGSQGDFCQLRESHEIVNIRGVFSRLLRNESLEYLFQREVAEEKCLRIVTQAQKTPRHVPVFFC